MLLAQMRPRTWRMQFPPCHAALPVLRLRTIVWALPRWTPGVQRMPTVKRISRARASQKHAHQSVSKHMFMQLYMHTYYTLHLCVCPFSLPNLPLSCPKFALTNIIMDKHLLIGSGPSGLPALPAVAAPTLDAMLEGKWDATARLASTDAAKVCMEEFGEPTIFFSGDGLWATGRAFETAVLKIVNFDPYYSGMLNLHHQVHTISYNDIRACVDICSTSSWKVIKLCVIEGVHLACLSSFRSLEISCIQGFLATLSCIV